MESDTLQSQTCPEDVPASSSAPFCAERQSNRVNERLGEYRLYQVGTRETGVLGLYAGEVCLPNPKPSKVQTTQVATQHSHEVHHIAGPIPMHLERAVAPAIEQGQQLRLHVNTFGLESLQDRLCNQALLRLPNVLFGLGLDEWVFHQLHWPPTPDLIGNIVDQPVGHVLEHDRLQRERRHSCCFDPLHQRTAAQRLNGLQASPAAGARAERSQQRGQADRLAFHRQHAHHLLLER